MRILPPNYSGETIGGASPTKRRTELPTTMKFARFLFLGAPAASADVFADFGGRFRGKVGDAAKGSLTITVRDGTYDDVSAGFDPTLHFSGESVVNDDVVITYGLDAEVQNDADVRTWPRLVWGEAVASVAGWGVSALAEADENAAAVVELRADSADFDLKVRMLASASRDGGVKVDGVEATKGFDVNDSTHLTLTPRYDVENDVADLVLGCDVGTKTSVEAIASVDAQSVTIKHAIMSDTDIKLAASAEYQELTISQQLDEDNRVSPTLNSDGKFAVEWERRVGEDSTVIATLRPNDAIDVEWQDRDWTAMIKLPLDGADIKSSAITVKRDVTF